MFKSSPSVQAYTNIFTIEERIKEASTTLGMRILAAQKSKSKTNYVIERKNILRKQVGIKLYDEIFDLVNKIMLVRKTNSVWTEDLDNEKNLNEKVKVIPSAVRLIYFGTELLSSVKALEEKTNSLQIEKVTEPSWECLVIEARHNLRQFQKFQKDKPQYNFLCGFGCNGRCFSVL